MEGLIDIRLECPVETAREGAEVTKLLKEKRKVDLVVHKLDRYGVTIGALQIMKWFGVAEYRVGKVLCLQLTDP